MLILEHPLTLRVHNKPFSVMKNKLFAALIALVASAGLTTYVASAQTTKTPCSGCDGGNVKCCRAANGDIYYRS